MPDLDWPTVAFIALLIIGFLVLLWIVVFALMARHVARFQKDVTQAMKLGNADAPTWKSSTTVRRPNPRFRHGRSQAEDDL